MNNGGECAYPIFYNDEHRFIFQNGLTKRELFAAMAMQGILARPGMVIEDRIYVSQFSVAAADSLIAALEKEPQA